MEDLIIKLKTSLKIDEAQYQTKDWRKNAIWYKNGKYNECEKYQIDIIEKLLNKTYKRINTETSEIIENKNHDGYEWTENFDGIVEKNDKIYYLYVIKEVLKQER